MRVRVGVAAFVAASVLAATVGGCSATGDSQKDAYKIGAVVSLSGTYAGLGDPEKKAIEMEVARVNADGGVNGRDIEVIFLDDATDEAQAQGAAEQLVLEDEVLSLIGASGTGQSMAMRTVAQEYDVPQVSMAGGTVITQEFDPLVFQTPWSNTLVVPYVLKSIRDAGFEKVGLMTDGGGYGKDGRGVILNSAPAAGVAIVADEVFNPGDTDMTTQLTKIRSSGAEVLLMWTAGREASTVVKSLDQLGMDIPVYGGPGIARKEFIEGAGASADGVRFAAGKILVPSAYGEGTDAFGIATDFVSRYEESYGQSPDIFAGHAYDAFNLIVEAMKRLPEEFSPADLRDEIEKTSGFVGVGGTFTFSETDHNGIAAQDLVMYEIVNGEWKLAE